MSVRLSSKQFKQDINSLFTKLHSFLTGLEAKIIERDESLREEIKQEIFANLRPNEKDVPSLKDQKLTETEKTSDNPVSMVVPVDPSQFIGTTIKHTSNYISDQTINLTIRAGVASNSVNTKPAPNCHSPAATTTSSTTSTTNATTSKSVNTNVIKSLSNNGSSLSSSSCYLVNENGSNSSRPECDILDEPFKKIRSAIGNSHANNSVSVPSGVSSDEPSKEKNNRVKENRCPMCAQRFTQLNSLKRHIRSHTGERPFPCGYCEKRFVDRERLKVHVRIHTGEKPFSCNLCSRRFSQKSTVKRHMSVHTGAKPFQCASCSKRFGTRDNLRVHEKSHFQVELKFKNINNNQVQPDNMDYL